MRPDMRRILRGTKADARTAARRSGGVKESPRPSEAKKQDGEVKEMYRGGGRRRASAAAQGREGRPRGRWRQEGDPKMMMEVRGRL